MMLVNTLQGNAVNSNQVVRTAQSAADRQQQKTVVSKDGKVGPAAVFQHIPAAEYNTMQLTPLQKNIINVQNQINSLHDGKPLSAQEKKSLEKTLSQYLQDLQNGDSVSAQGSNSLSPQQWHKELVNDVHDMYNSVQNQINNPYNYLFPNGRSSLLGSFNQGSANGLFQMLQLGDDMLQNNYVNDAVQGLDKRITADENSLKSALNNPDKADRPDATQIKQDDATIDGLKDIAAGLHNQDNDVWNLNNSSQLNGQLLASVYQQSSGVQSMIHGNSNLQNIQQTLDIMA